jgi:hypothetical protein
VDGAAFIERQRKAMIAAIDAGLLVVSA